MESVRSVIAASSNPLNNLCRLALKQWLKRPGAAAGVLVRRVICMVMMRHLPRNLRFSSFFFSSEYADDVWDWVGRVLNGN